jgi:hypothetical protein
MAGKQAAVRANSIDRKRAVFGSVYPGSGACFKPDKFFELIADSYICNNNAPGAAFILFLFEKVYERKNGRFRGGFSLGAAVLG